MGERARVGHLVGYVSENTYKIWFRDTGKIVNARDVTFDEDIANYDNDNNDSSTAIQSSCSKPLSLPPSLQQIEYNFTEHTNRRDQPIQSIENADSDNRFDPRVITLTPDFAIQPAPVRETVQIHKRKGREQAAEPPRISARANKGQRTEERFEDYQARTMRNSHSEFPDLLMQAITPQLKTYEVKVPSNYRKTLNSKQRELWQIAMESQIAKLEAIPAWEIVDIPTPKPRILPDKWVYDLKNDSNNNVEMFRARWVICGNWQQEGLDYDEVSSPVIVDALVKIFIAIVTVRKLKWYQFDIVTAYLNAELKSRTIYIMYPTGLAPTGFAPTGLPLVCRLLRALYGLKQSGLLWNQVFDDVLRDLGLVPTDTNSCFYMGLNGIILILYVDDSIVAGPSQEIISDFIKKLKQKFTLKVIGEPKRFLGYNIERDYINNTITISQKAYTKRISAHLNADIKPAEFPMFPGWKPSDSSALNDEMKSDFCKRGGRLIWLLKTRPDIQFPVYRIFRRNKDPNEADMNAALHIFRYLVNTPDRGLVLGRDPEGPLYGYVDSSHTDCEGSRSTEAFIFFYRGSPIS
ncbi:uncharacterized protein KD926_001614 [Aspergillus affinis]|uniref:uncharacterized protein n=1 Tax=Aspergillus affinis TaxID=1070780 RepID=UPI0022FEB015|nr:uncharacterized protein KD926_001614 [Aspergillus affinis]KAI9036660.1 hypothetical protein KD926_001614 [Aspergillus affinis]